MAVDVSQPVHAKRKSGFSDRWLASLLLTPSVIALLIFVYGFIGTTFWISLSKWRSATPNWHLNHPLNAAYVRLFHTPRFQTDIRNTIIFTVLFLAVAVGIGLLFAILLDQRFPGSVIFRNIFLFPYALSFIVTGVAWRWIFNPETGINKLLNDLGLNWLLGKIGLGPFHPGWLTDPKVSGDLRNIVPGLGGLYTQVGIPHALIPVVIAAAWQLSGFAMAMYLAGLGSISNDVREAAQLDGASTFQMYRQIILPLLKPITVSTLIILGHVSLKIFDLIYAMSGSGPGFSTDVLGIYVLEQTFRATRYDLGAGASIVMLLLVAIVIVPYLVRTMRED